MHDNGPSEQIKRPPSNVEAEQQLLGTILLDNTAFDGVNGILEPDHFYDPVHAKIFALAKHFIAKDKIASPVTLKPMLQMNDGFNELGGTDYLIKCVASCIAVSVAPDYARLIRDLWSRRCAIEVAERIIEQASDFENPDQTTDQVIDLAEGELATLRTDTETEKPFVTYAEAMAEAMQLASDAYQRGGEPEISTGMDKLDDKLGGLQRGRLIVLGGRTAMGKTALALQLAGNVADAGGGVLFASFEMPAFELAQRYASTAAHVSGLKMPYRNFATGSMEESQFQHILQQSRDTEGRSLAVVGEDKKEITRLRSSIRTASRHFERKGTPLKLLVVDYIQLAKASHANSRVEEVSYCARDLKSIAKTYNIPVIGLSQVKREVDDRKDRRPGLSDLRWAGEIEEAADQVMFVYRQSYYDDKDAREMEDDEERAALKFRADKDRQKMEVLVEKNRGGPTGQATIWADMATNRVCNENPAHAPDPRQADMGDFE
jgi:replicative DNA helicase